MRHQVDLLMVYNVRKTIAQINLGEWSTCKFVPAEFKRVGAEWRAVQANYQPCLTCVRRVTRWFRGQWLLMNGGPITQNALFARCAKVHSLEQPFHGMKRKRSVRAATANGWPSAALNAGSWSLVTCSLLTTRIKPITTTALCVWSAESPWLAWSSVFAGTTGFAQIAIKAVVTLEPGSIPSTISVYVYFSHAWMNLLTLLFANR